MLAVVVTLGALIGVNAAIERKRTEGDHSSERQSPHVSDATTGALEPCFVSWLIA